MRDGLGSVDDIGPLFDAAPTGPGQPVTYRQGVIVSFNPVTLENVVRVGGTELTNLPLLGVGEAMLLTAGATVGILVVGSGNTTMYITGRIVIPNTEPAFEALALLSANLHADTVTTQETYTSAAAFGDLATVGPEVTVTVRQTGRILVICSAQIQWAPPAAAASVGVGGWVSVMMNGANTMTALSAAVRLLPAFNVTAVVSAGTLTHTCQATATQQAVFEGLSPGDTTIRMQYLNQVSGNNVDYGRRTLTVFTL